MARRNRVDPFGDLHAVAARQGFTGNRGCLVNDDGRLVRHHNGSLWILCKLRFRDWRHPLDAPRTWTPLFFLDDAVGLAAGHRPCGLCRRDDYLAYRAAVTQGLGAERPVLAPELNRRLATERLGRLSRGRDRGGRRSLDRGPDRLLTAACIDDLPSGAVIVGPDRRPHVLVGDRLRAFGFGGWGEAVARPTGMDVEVITPPTSVLALANGFTPSLHPSAVPIGLPRNP